MARQFTQHTACKARPFSEQFTCLARPVVSRGVRTRTRVAVASVAAVMGRKNKGKPGAATVELDAKVWHVTVVALAIAAREGGRCGSPATELCRDAAHTRKLTNNARLLSFN